MELADINLIEDFVLNFYNELTKMTSVFLIDLGGPKLHKVCLEEPIMKSRTTGIPI